MAGERTPPLLHPALGRGWRSGPLERGAKPSPSPAGTWGAPQPPLLCVPRWEGKQPGDLGERAPPRPGGVQGAPVAGPETTCGLRPWEVRVGRRRPEALSRVGSRGAGAQTASASKREGMLFFPGPDPQKCSPPPHPPPFPDPPNARTVLGRAAGLSTVGRVFFLSFFFVLLISFVSYLYIVMLMSNSCGADGRGVNGSQSLRISLPITHLAPVAISPRALWWRRRPRRPLGAGAFALFPGFECHLSVWRTNAPRWPRLAPHPGASGVPEPGHVPSAPSPPRHPQPAPPLPRLPRPGPRLREKLQSVISFLNITFTPAGTSDEKTSSSRLWVSKESKEIQ